MKGKKYIVWTRPTAICLVTAMPIAAAIRQTIFVYVLMAASLFFFVKVIPFCRRRENLWMFFLVAICSIPPNVCLISSHIQIYRKIWCLLFRSTAYLFLLSVEEIIMAFITRRLWKRQYKLPYSD